MVEWNQLTDGCQCNASSITVLKKLITGKSMLTGLKGNAVKSAFLDLQRTVDHPSFKDFNISIKVDADEYRTWLSTSQSNRTSVQINVGQGAQGMIAERNGKRWLCHTGVLNGRLKVSRLAVIDTFRTQVDQVYSTDGRTKEYIVVACIDDPLNQIGLDLRRFVYGCDALVGAARKLDIPADPRARHAAILARGIPKGNPKPQKTTIVTQYSRDPEVTTFAKMLADGVCELCENPAPFATDDGPFLEVHHLIPMSEGGPDTPDNVVALCPNCHRSLHYAKDAASHTERLVRMVKGRLDQMKGDKR